MRLYEQMQRSFEEEILDGEGLPAELVDRAHRGMSLAHKLLGNHAAIVRALKQDGPAVRREGDYFGASVNLAARLLSLAERDELLATAPVVERCQEFDWEHCGSERLRGLSDEVQVFRLRP